MASKQITIRDYTKEIPGELSPDGTVWYFPLVKSTNSHGKPITWRVQVRPVIAIAGEQVDPSAPRYGKIVDKGVSLLDNKTTTVTIDGVKYFIYGWIKVESNINDGVTRLSVPTLVTTGKNAKSKSATTPFCQALRDAFSMHNKQLRKAVSTIKAGDTIRYPPMLAQVMNRDKVEAVLQAEPCYLQRKYNGVRVVTTLADVDGVQTVIMYSRRGVLYPGFDYIKRELAPVLLDYAASGVKLYLDGEVYKHGAALQDISGSARKEGQDIKCEYMVYDCFNPADEGMIYSRRRQILREMFDVYDLEYVTEVPTWVVASLTEIDELFAEALRAGYEGAMLRLDRPYKYSYNEHHASILLKIKPTLDAEFTIAGWETGLKGKAAGAFMIICKTATGLEFPVTPAMEIEARIALTNKIEGDPSLFAREYAGKPLIVYYDELSKDGVPQRARTKMEIRTWD